MYKRAAVGQEAFIATSVCGPLWVRWTPTSEQISYDEQNSGKNRPQLSLFQVAIEVQTRQLLAIGKKWLSIR